MKFLCWDIDGTLLRTDKAGLYAFKQAATDILGCQKDFSNIRMAGMTDHCIAGQIIQMTTGKAPSETAIDELLSHYETLLPEHLIHRKGHLLPTVRETLDFFADKPDYVSLLLTGNTPLGAKAKLSCHGIDSYFDFGLSAFGRDCTTRLELAANALEHIRSKHPSATTDEIFVIGDTEKDIACGKYIQARTIALATGMCSYQELTTHAPWLLLRELPSPQAFASKLH